MYITVSDEDINLSLDPTINNGYDTTSFTVNVGTNNLTGYSLYLNADGDNNALINTSNSSKTIPALPNTNSNNGYNESNFPSNTWGYNSNGVSWSFVGSTNYFPLSTTSTLIDSTDAPTNSQETTIGLASKVDFTTASGTYTKDLIISVIPVISTYELNYNANTTETVTNLPLPLVMNHWSNIAPAIPIDTTSIPSRDGYNFKGYTTTQNGDTAEYVYDESTNTFTPATFTPASSTALSDTLYAVWEEDVKLISFTFYYQIGASSTPTTWTAQAEEGMTFREWILSKYFIINVGFLNCGGPGLSECADNDTQDFTLFADAMYSANIFPDGDKTKYKQGDAVLLSTVITDGMIFGAYEEQVCFPAGTQVQVSLDGATANIEDLKVGDTIVAYDITAGQKYITTINYTWVKTAHQLSTVTFDNGTILKLTPNHPLHSATGGWKSVNPAYNENPEYPTTQLNIGDAITTINGESRVTDISTKNITEGMTVYNLSVQSNNGDKDNNNYFAEGILVHNAY